MPPEWTEALKIGGPVATVLGVFVFWLVTGKIVPRWVHDQALADKDTEIARANAREAEVWTLLKHTAGWMDQATAAAERATQVAVAAHRAAPPALPPRPRSPRRPKAPPGPPA